MTLSNASRLGRMAALNAGATTPKFRPRRRSPAFWIWWGWVLGCLTVVVGSLVL